MNVPTAIAAAMIMSSKMALSRSVLFPPNPSSIRTCTPLPRESVAVAVNTSAKLAATKRHLYCFSKARMGHNVPSRLRLSLKSVIPWADNPGRPLIRTFPVCCDSGRADGLHCAACPGSPLPVPVVHLPPVEARRATYSGLDH